MICLASPRPPAKKLFARPCAYTMPMIHPLSFLQDSDSEQDEAAADPENPACCAGSISSHAAAVPAATAGPAVAARSHAAAEAATGMQSSSDEPPARKRMRVAAGSVCLTIKQEGLPPSWPEGAFVKEEAEEGLPPAWPEGAFVKQEAEEGLPPAWPEGAFVKEEQKEQQDQQQQAQEVTSGTGAGGSGSSTQGRKLSAGMLVHAFHCTDPACQQKTCAEAKLVLKRMEVHWQQCPRRRAQQSAQQGGPPPQQAECKVCKLWEALHRTKSSSSQQSVQQRGGMQSSAAGRGQPHRPSGGPTAQNGEPSEAVRARLRQIDPAQLKQRLLSHVRACKNEQCRTCHKLRECIKSRERIKSREASSSQHAQGQHAHEQQPPSTGHEPHGTGGDVGPTKNFSLSVPALLTTIKQFVPPEKHEQLDQILQRYMQKELSKQQVCSSSSPVSTPPCLTLAPFSVSPPAALPDAPPPPFIVAGRAPCRATTV